MNTLEVDQTKGNKLTKFKSFIELIKKHSFIISIVSGFSCAMTSTLFYKYLGELSFFRLQSLSFTFYAISLHLTTYKNFTHTPITKTLIVLVVLCTASNSVDEFIYDATKLELNDLIRLITITITTLLCKRYFKNLDNNIKSIEGLFREHFMDVAIFAGGAFGSAMADRRSEVKFTRKERLLRLSFGRYYGYIFN